jgi:hypothetical protein
MNRDQERRQEAAHRPYSDQREKPSSTPETADQTGAQPGNEAGKRKVAATAQRHHASPGRRPLFGS